MRVHEEPKHNAGYGEMEYMKFAVESRIETALGTVHPSTLRDAMAHAAFGGKMLRPILTMLSCTAVGGTSLAALDAATAIEMLHTSSLIHDDIMDESPLRRGRATVHTEFGVPFAILAGDTFIALAFRLIHTLDSPNRETILGTFTDSFRNVCEGQGYDLCLTNATCAESSAHETMVEKKTAKLFEAATKIGALCGTVHRGQIAALASFGYNLGMAFQAQDDLLDATGSEYEMGKPVAADAKNGKGTFLSLVYPSRAASHQFDHAVAATTNVVESYTRNACKALDRLPANDAMKSLRVLAESLVHRKD